MLGTKYDVCVTKIFVTNGNMSQFLSIIGKRILAISNMILNIADNNPISEIMNIKDFNFLDIIIFS